MMLRKPIDRAFKVACKLLIFAALCTGVFIALSTGPASAHTRVTIGIGVGVGGPFYHHGSRHGYYGHFGYYPHFRRYGHYGGYRGYGRYHGYPVPVVVAPYPVVYPAPVYPGPVYSAPTYSAPAYGSGVPSYCREFRTTININGKLQPAWGTACLQPDGTWRFVQ